MRSGGEAGLRRFFRDHRGSLVRAATLLLIVGACALIYSVPWRVSSWEDLPRIVCMQDHWVYYLPNAYYMDVSLHDYGEFPLWNPLTFCGLPFAANPQSMAFYPPNLLRSILTFEPTPFRSHATLVLMLVFHVILAGYGTYLLAREHGLSYGACLVCVFAFLFSAGVVRRTLADVYLTTIAWRCCCCRDRFARPSRRRGSGMRPRPVLCSGWDCSPKSRRWASIWHSPWDFTRSWSGRLCWISNL